MATHQQMAGFTDEQMVTRMVESYADRFDDEFWTYFNEKVNPHLPQAPLMVDLGCGPGLFLQDLSERYPAADLYGYDLTQAMIDHADTLGYEGKKPVLRIHDISSSPLLLGDNSVHMLSMVAVLHVLDDPIEACREIVRLLAHGGIFLLQDWVRTPLPQYFERMGIDSDPENKELIRKRLYNLFPAHNKFTLDDWLYVLKSGGLKVIDHQQLRSPHFSVFVCQAYGS